MARPPLVFVLVGMEGPDPYSQAGGLGVRVTGLAHALARAGHETHLVFCGDPERPPVERHGHLTYWRVAQPVSARHPQGVYAGEAEKLSHLAASLPTWLVGDRLAPAIAAGCQPVAIFEEWQTAPWVRRTSDLLHAAGLRDRALLLWNVNNQFRLDGLDFGTLAFVAGLTTVSRFMKQLLLGRFGADAVVIPNGVPDDAFRPVPEDDVRLLRRAAEPRTLLLKIGRYDPGKRWLQAVRAVGQLRRQRRPVRLLARGGVEPHGVEVLALARALGLSVGAWDAPIGDARALADALLATAEVDVLELRSFLPADLLPVLYRAAGAVLANSGFEPFGLVGLETMARGGVAVVGATGEDYARHLHNSLVIETEDPVELALALASILDDPGRADRLRAAARATARTYRWPLILADDLVPRLPVLAARQGVSWPAPGRGRVPQRRG